MHAMNESEGARLMAHWLATGGAIDADAFEAAGDDGLSASPTRGYLCQVDDGLMAVQVSTDMPHPLCSGDDGLEAGGRLTHTGRLSCGRDCGDDGLKAGSPTGFHIPGVCADDGLAL